ncbi:MAG TPA: nitrous oxide reductase accessory protein NosL [Phnomibacter sp.]|nr:nitrous oxide reductase accessory protein NosL [Phnomibacter sp.]
MKLSKLSIGLVLLAAAALVISLFVPVWSIYLDAPQYPEGLSLQIWANKIAGDVDIINGLNHYIGMKTLHSNEFIEFTVLPYIIAGFALLFVIVALTRSKKGLIAALVAFVIFGIVAMIDFWKWEYDYGHNLDPNAAIKVPGMAYQPPLIGFKQLLNFGAYSIPDIGGWLFVVAGVLLIVALVVEKRIAKKLKKSTVAATVLPLMLLLVSCGSSGPEPITYNKDACASCKMQIADARLAAEIVTQKGRAYKFDDISCLLHFTASGQEVAAEKIYVCDYENAGNFTDATQAFFVTSEIIKSPMGGNTAAFSNKENAEAFATKNNTTVLAWGEIEKAKQGQQDNAH